MNRSSSCAVGLAIVLACAVACSSKPPIQPLVLDGGRLTVNNRSDVEWSKIEIWLNRYFRVTWASLPPGGRLDVQLDSFVSGYGHKFDRRRIQIRDLRLTAVLPDGKPLEIKKEFEGDALSDVLGNMQKKQ
jgi:hypothetical protein